jgi:hypothetical protein
VLVALALPVRARSSWSRSGSSGTFRRLLTAPRRHRRGVQRVRPRRRRACTCRGRRSPQSSPRSDRLLLLGLVCWAALCSRSGHRISDTCSMARRGPEVYRPRHRADGDDPARPDRHRARRPESNMPGPLVPSDHGRAGRRSSCSVSYLAAGCWRSASSRWCSADRLAVRRPQGIRQDIEGDRTGHLENLARAQHAIPALRRPRRARRWRLPSAQLSGRPRPRVSAKRRHAGDRPPRLGSAANRAAPSGGIWRTEALRCRGSPIPPGGGSGGDVIGRGPRTSTSRPADLDRPGRQSRSRLSLRQRGQRRPAQRLAQGFERGPRFFKGGIFNGSR